MTDEKLKAELKKLQKADVQKAPGYLKMTNTMNNDKIRDNASQILDFPLDLSIEVISGLIELANNSGSGRGYRVVSDDGEGWLEDRKEGEGNTILKGYSQSALTKIASIVRGR